MRTSALARLAVMGLLMGGLMIPLTMVQGVVSERTSRRDGAAQEISGVWGGAQTLAGPVLSIPYEFKSRDQYGALIRGTTRTQFLPEQIDVKGTVTPEIRRRGLFEVVVYAAQIEISGRFAPADFSDVRPDVELIRWDQASLNLGVADPKGLSRVGALTWNGREERFAPGVEEVGLFTAGMHAPVHDLSPASGTIAFAIALDLNGNRHLRFLPAGNESSVQLTSSWPHPSFIGAPLPLSRDVTARGFSASWRAPYFGRGYPPRWTATMVNFEQLRTLGEASAFGVALVQPVDIYQQSERAVKYAALFIVLTFVIAFLWEVGRGALLHPIQYLFLGFAMCVFYLLLVSLSEHVGFDRAYAAGSTATIALLAWYWSRVIGGARQGVLMGAALTTLYGFLYLLLRLEDYALLAGSIGLFLMLAAVMYFTRRVNWYDLRLGTAAGQG